jgi:dienelactone hydrolase
MNTEKIRYHVDGIDMESQLFYEPGEDHRPGVLVFPEGFGLGEHTISRAKRLASMGYVALACDLHGDGKVVDSLDEVMALIGPLRADVARIRERAQGGLDVLKSHPAADAKRIAAIGFCFGGTMALELARSGADIAGVVSFHGGLSTTAPQDAKNIKGKILVCTGADDPRVPADQRRAFEEEMTAGKVDWHMTVYGGAVHGFTNPAIDKLGTPEIVRYDAKADARSWQQMSTFFGELFEVVQ